MSSALDELGGVFAKHDLDNELEAHRDATEQVEQIYEELENQLAEENSDLDDSEQKQVKSAFEQIVREDIEDLLDGDHGIADFTDEIESISRELEDILRSPQAEAVVNNLTGWLLSTGLDPLTEEKQVELRETVKSDIKSSQQAVKDAIAAHDSLRGYLGDAQKEIDQMILEEVKEVSSVGDLESLAGGLERLDGAWTGDWKLEYETNAGETLYQEVLEQLEEDLIEEVAGQSKLGSLAAVLDNKSGRRARHLDRIKDNWLKIEERTERIDSTENSFDASDALDMSKAVLGPVASISQYGNALKNTSEALRRLQKAEQTDLEAYELPESDNPEELEEILNTLDEMVDVAKTKRNAAFSAEQASENESRIEEFNQQVEKLEDELTKLQEIITSEIGTTRKLATKFELEEPGSDLNDLYTDASNSETTSELVEVFRDYRKVEAEVRNTVHDQLSQNEEELFTFLLQFSSSDKKSHEVWNRAVEETELEEKKLLENLVSLKEKDLVDIDVQVA